MGEPTPVTTEFVREHYSKGPIAYYEDGRPVRMPSPSESAYMRRQFDAWLAAHDEEVREKAILEQDNFVHEVEELRVVNALSLIEDVSGLLAVASEESLAASQAWIALQDAQWKGLNRSIRDHDAEVSRKAASKALGDAASEWLKGAWADAPRYQDRVKDRLAAAQYFGDWLRQRAEELRRAER